jgi:hypothetical protein
MRLGVRVDRPRLHDELTALQLCAGLRHLVPPEIVDELEVRIASQLQWARLQGRADREFEMVYQQVHRSPE